MHMEYSDDSGLFQWPEYRLVNVEYVDNDDSDLYEHSFASVNRVAVVSSEASISDP